MVQRNIRHAMQACLYAGNYKKKKIHTTFNSETTSFSDGFPLLMLGQSSLDDLNKRLTESLPVNRFRPNIMFTGGEPFEEDQLEHFVINGIDCFCCKALCKMYYYHHQPANFRKKQRAFWQRWLPRKTTTIFILDRIFYTKGMAQ